MGVSEKHISSQILDNPEFRAGYLHDDQKILAFASMSDTCYWELDSELLVSKYIDVLTDSAHSAIHPFVGKHFQDTTLCLVEGDEDWSEFCKTLEQRKPFENVKFWRYDPVMGNRCLSISGMTVSDDDGHFSGYRGITRDCTLIEKSQRLTELEHSVFDLLLITDKKTDAIGHAIQLICESEGWEAGKYWSVDEIENVIKPYEGWCIDVPEMESFINNDRFNALKPGEGLVGIAWESGEVSWVKDLDKENNILLKESLQRTGWKNALICPVKSGDKVIGVISFLSRYIAEPDAHMLQFLQSLGSHLGIHFKHHEAREALLETEALFASTVLLAPMGIAHVDFHGNILMANKTLNSMLGYEQDELVGKNVKEISHPEDKDVTDENREKLATGKIDSYKIEKRYLKKDGNFIWVSLTITRKQDIHGHTDYDISMVEDITSRREAEEKIQYLANYDDLTGLANRSLFLEMLNYTIDSSERYNREFAVMFIDLDRFKQINDSLGHEAGDKLLKVMSNRIKNTLRSSDMVARLGGDEFVVLLSEASNKKEVTVVARNLLTQIIKPVQIMNQECRVTASLGICLFPENAKDAKSLMKLADMAMYKAKESGKNTFEFYNNDMQANVIERMQMEARIRTALENDEFEVYYQAKVNTDTSKIQGVEALLRWNSPELGQVSPGLFIPIAEEMGLIVNIGKWVIKQAALQCKNWQTEGLEPITVSVNLSARQFVDKDLVPFIENVLKEIDLDASYLEIEITESMVMHNITKAIEILTKFKELGLKIAIDDFGTGYSSLSQLKLFPIDTLKVDRSFIREIETDKDDQAITEAIISMGKTLGLTVVAEGVENKEQQNLLQKIKCDQLQGFYFSRPSPAKEFKSFIQNHSEK